ncbi:MAG: hypothetical protein ACI841_003304, partial [Planctomycetota bacterium]
MRWFDGCSARYERDTRRSLKSAILSNVRLDSFELGVLSDASILLPIRLVLFDLLANSVAVCCGL